MSTPFEALMTYNGDGTYSYNYTLSVIGKVSICVILRNTGIVYGDFYPNYSLTGSPDVSNISTTIDYNWGSGVVVSGLSDLVSATFNSYLRPNVTDTYTIYCSMDNGADVYINGVAIISKFGTGYYGEISTTYSFVANTNYKLFVKWQENTGGASIKLSWDYTGVSKIIIPYPNYVWPQFVGSSPFTFTISCPTGYSSTILNYPNQCYPFCGDGKRVGVEVCDDGNTKNGDGCKDDCLQIEYNCNCIGGSISSKDTCSCIVEQTPTTVSHSKEILIIIIISSTLFCMVIIASITAILIELRFPMKRSRLNRKYHKPNPKNNTVQADLIDSNSQIAKRVPDNLSINVKPENIMRLRELSQ